MGVIDLGEGEGFTRGSGGGGLDSTGGVGGIHQAKRGGRDSPGRWGGMHLGEGEGFTWGRPRVSLGGGVVFQLGEGGGVTRMRGDSPEWGDFFLVGGFSVPIQPLIANRKPLIKKTKRKCKGKANFQAKGKYCFSKTLFTIESKVL